MVYVLILLAVVAGFGLSLLVYASRNCIGYTPSPFRLFSLAVFYIFVVIYLLFPCFTP